MWTTRMAARWSAQPWGCWGLVGGLCLMMLAVQPVLAQDVRSPLDDVRALLSRQAYGEADRVLSTQEAHAADDPGVMALRARWLMESTPPDYQAAEALLQRGLRRHPDDSNLQAAELLRRHRQPGFFLPTLRDARLGAFAKRVRRQDSTSSAPHFVLGVLAYEAFERLNNAVAFPTLGPNSQALEEAMIDQIALLDVSPAPDSMGGSLVFEDRRGTGLAFQAIGKQAEAEEQYAAALAHYRRAVADPAPVPDLLQRYLQLTALRGDWPEAQRALDALTPAMGQTATFHRLAGLVAERQGHYEAAGVHFEAAWAKMSSVERWPFTFTLPLRDGSGYPAHETTRSTAETAGDADRYWATQDAWLLTAFNERRIEHFARMVYADLRFGDTKRDRKGWETDPGETIVRYGIPVAEAQYNDMTVSYLVLHYGDLFFKFMDHAKADRYVFYSPSAVDFAGARNVHREWDNDFAIRGPETFKAQPVQSRLFPELADIPVLAAGFKGANETNEVLIAIERDQLSGAALKWGAFLLDPLSGHLIRGTELASGLFALSGASGDGQIIVEAEGEAGRAGRGRADLELTDYIQPGLAMSDVLPATLIEDAEPGEASQPPRGAFVREGFVIYPAVEERFGPEASIYLYVEVYGLSVQPAQQARYEMEVLLEPTREAKGLRKALGRFWGGGKRGVAVRFEGMTNGPTDARYLVLDPETVPPGTYSLTLSVEDVNTGEQVSRIRKITIEE